MLAQFMLADAQKLAKQSIYSLHRSDMTRAVDQLKTVGAWGFSNAATP